jgi:uncharacterized protein (DUF433 family)
MSAEAEPKSVATRNITLGKPVIAGMRITVEHIEHIIVRIGCWLDDQ